MALPKVRSQVGRMVEEIDVLIKGFNNLHDRVYELERKVRILEGKGSIIKEVPP